MSSLAAHLHQKGQMANMVQGDAQTYFLCLKFATGGTGLLRVNIFH